MRTAQRLGCEEKKKIRKKHRDSQTLSEAARIVDANIRNFTMQLRALTSKWCLRLTCSGEVASASFPHENNADIPRFRHYPRLLSSDSAREPQ